MTSEEEWQSVVEEGAGAFGKINVLVNNAGIESRFITGTEIVIDGGQSAH